MSTKPIHKFKGYGTIPHLPSSKLTDGKDRIVDPGLDKIATKTGQLGNGTYVWIYVQQKMDGSCVGILRTETEVIPITRAGYRASTSGWVQHQLFASWVMRNFSFWWEVLKPNELLCGEWLAQVHATRYMATCENDLFWAFDLFKVNGRKKTPYRYEQCVKRFCVDGNWLVNWVPVVAESRGAGAIWLERILENVPAKGVVSMAQDPIEGFVWRVEDPVKDKLLFTCKWVRPDFEPGKWLHLDVFNPPYQEYGRGGQIIFV